MESDEYYIRRPIEDRIECYSCLNKVNRQKIRRRRWKVGESLKSGTTTTTTGTSGSYNSAFPDRKSNSTSYRSGSKTTNYSSVPICNKCYFKRLTFISISYAISVFAFFIIIISLQNSPRKSIDNPVSSRQNDDKSEKMASDNIESRNDSTASQAPDRDGPDMDVGSGIKSERVIIPENSDEIYPNPNNNNYLREKIIECLDDCRNYRWRGGGFKGGVSISSGQNYDSYTCKSFRYTIDYKDKVIYFDGKACKSTSGDWDIENSYKQQYQ